MNLFSLNWILEFYTQSSFKIKALFISIVVLTLLCIAVLLVLVTLRMKLYSRRNKTEVLKSNYEELIITLLYLDPEGLDYKVYREESISQLKEVLDREIERKVLNEILINLHRDIAGDMANQIQDLYLELGLIKYAHKKLKSARWYVKIQGIRDLTQMQDRSIESKVMQLVNHKNKLLRNEAQLAIVRLFSVNGLSFLKDLHYAISEWQQLQLMAVIQQNVELITPELKDFLKVKNVSVVQFTLKLIRLFNQMVEPQDLKMLIEHPDSMVRQQAIELIAELGLFDMKTFLKDQYYDLNKIEKLEVIHTLSQLGTEEDLEFLIEQSGEEDFKISLQAILALKEMIPPDSLKDKLDTIGVKNEEVYKYVMAGI